MQQEDNNILVPDHISKWGIYSGHIFVIVAIVAWMHKYYEIVVIAVMLYVSSMLYWKKVNIYSGRRIMDIIIVLGVAYYVAFYASKRFTIEKREILICLIIIMALVHIVNSAIFYFQTVEWLHEEKEEKTGRRRKIKNEGRGVII